MNKKLIIAIIVVIVVILGVWLSQNKPNNTNNVIKIGYYGPLTGAAAGTSGEDVANGYRIANSIQNMIGDKKVEIIFEDDACDPQKAVSAANKLINIDKVNILINGVCSGSMVAVAPIAESHKVILFTNVSESPKITTAGDYIFRISASSVLSAHAMVEGLNKLGLNKISVIFETAEYTVGMKDAFVKEFVENKSNKILATEAFASKDTDLRTQLSILAKAKPQILVVFANSTITANIITNQLKDLGAKLPIIGNTYFGSGPARTNPNNNGNYAIVYKYDTASPSIIKFLSDYKTRFGRSPTQDIYSALSYDGYNVIFQALQTCNGDNPDCIKTALYKVKNYQGIGGVVTIDQNGDTQREFTLKKIQDGSAVEVK